MARRKRSRSGSGPRYLIAAVVLLLLGGGGYMLWRNPPKWLTPTTPSAQTVVLPPARGALDVCGLIDPAAAATTLRVSGVDSRAVGASADVPAQGACTWSFGRDGRMIAQVFTRQSLAQGKVATFGHDYYVSAVTGLEYAFKVAPQSIPGLGDEAAIAGFDRDGGAEPPQLIARKGDTVLTLVSKGADRAATERFARALLADL